MCVSKFPFFHPVSYMVGWTQSHRGHSAQLMSQVLCRLSVLGLQLWDSVIKQTQLTLPLSG